MVNENIIIDNNDVLQQFERRPVSNKSNIIDRPDITFYLYSRIDNKLEMRETKICLFAWNVLTQKTPVSKLDYNDVKYVKFDNSGTFKLSLEDYSKEDYDMIKEGLSFYNLTGGKLTKCYGPYAVYNGKFVSSKQRPYYVGLEKPSDIKVETKEVVKEVKIQTLPRNFAEKLDFAQLRDLAKSWDIEIPEDIESSQEPKKIKEEYLKLLGNHLV